MTPMQPLIYLQKIAFSNWFDQEKQITHTLARTAGLRGYHSTKPRVSAMCIKIAAPSDSLRSPSVIAGTSPSWFICKNLQYDTRDFNFQKTAMIFCEHTLEICVLPSKDQATQN